jgi:Phosphoesterase family
LVLASRPSIISPYARQHYVDHTTYDFDSILRFIESRYSVPSLNSCDDSAANLANVLDFSQKPQPPMVLPVRHCPAADDSSSGSIPGRIVRIKSVGNLANLLLQLPYSKMLLTIEANQGTPVNSKDGTTVPLVDVAPGDWVSASAQPTPDKALYYVPSLIYDFNLRSVTTRGARVVRLGRNAIQFS